MNDNDIITFLQLEATPEIAAQVVQNVRFTVESRFIRTISELLGEEQLDELERRQKADEPLATTREWLFEAHKDAKEVYESLLADYLDELKGQTDQVTA